MMEKQKIIFFDTKPYDQEYFDQANQRFDYPIHYVKGHLNQESADFTAGYDAVCCFVNDDLSAVVIEHLIKNGVRLIAMRCAGYNNVDLKAAYGHIPVVRVPGYSPHAVAEHAAALMMTLNRKTHKAYARTREANFSIHGLLGFDLHGKTSGVIGTGRIGCCLIDILNGFGMRVLAYDLMPDPARAAEHNFSYVELDELYAQADVISLHCPLTPQTHHLISAQSIKKMRPGVMLINTGRGGLINTSDLINGLKSRQIGCAGLDVYEEEGDYFFEDFSFSVIDDDVLARLLTFPNVLVTSHQGFFTREAMVSIAETTLENIQEFFNGGYLKNEICYRCNNECRKKKKKRCF